jgi:hypothetical protein
MKGFDLKPRKALVNRIMTHYKKSIKKAKGKLLDEFAAVKGEPAQNSSAAKNSCRKKTAQENLAYANALYIIIITFKWSSYELNATRGRKTARTCHKKAPSSISAGRGL